MFRLLLRSSHPPSLTRYFHTQRPIQAGHNKWSKIKDKKGANDAQKSVLYTRMNREIINAVKVGGSADPEKNSMLATTLKKAREQGVPKDNIEKALAKAAGGKDQTGERIVYEALAFKSVGIIIECVTDNINRTIHNVREVLTAHGAHMTPVNFMFNHVGCLTVEVVDEAGDGDFSKFEEFVLNLDVIDLKQDNSSNLGGVFRVYCQPSNLAELQTAIENKKASGITLRSSELTYVPVDSSPDGGELQNQVQELVQDLEDIEDITKVWTTQDSS
ncbi:putative transcriptional regulatory protein [Psilocybe cubensis]|uniref:Transcriptional regulatory protein n=2 Tax=Psilocybe cubensis TaxID=181762 RepID=A0ACB8H7X8_PSICU|nr:putative transcriptional regulatory protein [Psilocybe cubensis]KAH9483747.1 putative transcriptional regulatory protein [Psilocybe cubensis]